MEKKQGIGFFEKYLTIWVALCIIIGIAVGQWLPAIPQTLSKFEYANVSIPVAILIWLMIYPMMLKVDFQSVKNVGKRPKGIIKGMLSFEKTVKYLQDNYPTHFLIADAKRGDIGNTSAMYAKTFFETYQVDALTIAPYMGEDSVKPFLAYQDKWAIVLALTSNKGSHDFQLTQDTTGMRLFEKVIATSSQWGTDENMMYVVGATQGKMFEDIRKVAPHHFLLVPGIGAQGGSLQEVCRYGMTKDCGLLVNSSRGILYASNDIHFAEAAKEAAKELQAQMKEELQAHC